MTHPHARFRPTRADPAYRAMVAFGLWLRAGSVGLGVAAIGLITVATGEAETWIGIATAIAGAAIATVAWRRALAIVDGDDAEGAVVPSSSAAATRPDRDLGAPRTAVSR